MFTNNAWTTFWEQGFPTSFASQFPNSYTGKLSLFWQSQFSKLSDAKILDLATGNGAIALIAAKTSKERSNNIEIYGSDLADIDPLKTSKNPELKDLYKAIKFLPNTPAEKLPFHDDQFSLITSQFGFEYSNRAKSIKEISRVLSMGGEFIAICHHVESRIHENCKDDFNAYIEATSRLSIDKKLETMAHLLLNSSSKDQVRKLIKSEPANSLTRALTSSLSKLTRLFPNATASSYFNGAARYLFGPFITASHSQKMLFISNLTKEPRSAHNRIEHQLESTLSDQDVKKYESLFQSHGLQKITSNFFQDNSGDILGWHFKFQKPSKLKISRPNPPT